MLTLQVAGVWVISGFYLSGNSVTNIPVCVFWSVFYVVFLILTRSELADFRVEWLSYRS